MTTISTCFWFDGRAEEAARFYVSLLPDSSVDHVSHYAIDTPGTKAGDVMLVEFTLAGVPYQILNGGPGFAHSPAASIAVECAGQPEVDRLWDALLADGGTPSQCGWLTDRFGLSWQIMPAGFVELLRSGDRQGAARASEAMMGMVKLDMAALRRAYDGA